MTEATASVSGVDQQLVDLLKQDGRMSYSDLGVAVGLSGDAVRERFKRLQSDGVVSIIGSVAPAVLGFTTFALVAIRVQGPVRPVALEIANIPAADLVVCVAGRFDILVQVVCRNDDELLNTIDTSIRTIPNLDVAEVFTYLTVDKYSAGFDPGFPPAPQAEVPKSLDDSDLALIRTLQQDGRASLRTLGEASGLTYTSARRRFRSLVDSGTVRIVTVENPLAVARHVQAGIGVRVAGPISKVRDAIRDIPEVDVAVTTAGTFDLMLEVTCRDKAALADLAGERLPAIDGVSSTQTFQYLDLVKLPFTWAGLESASLGS